MGRLTPTIASIALASVLASAWPAAAAPWVAVELNHVRRIILPGTAANVIVANPTIADVTVVDAHSVVIVGKAFGETEVMVTDHAGHTLLDNNVAVGKSEGGGQVTVYRGLASEDLSCAPRCQGSNALSNLLSGGASGGGVSSSSTTSSSGAQTVTSVTISAYKRTTQ